MISFIKGTVEYIGTDRIYLDHNGIGFEIFIPQTEIGLLSKGQEMTYYTYMAVREDAITLFGFEDMSELEMFKKLITVSGVGPKGALGVISNCPGDLLVSAIISGDEKLISSAPGIGKKTAQKIIIELRDKIDVSETFETGNTPRSSNDNDSSRNEAILALTSLGYSQSQAYMAVSKIEDTDEMSVEDILKMAFKFIQ